MGFTAEEKRVAANLKKELKRIVTEDMTKARNAWDVLDAALDARRVAWRLVNVAAAASGRDPSPPPRPVTEGESRRAKVDG